MTTTEQQTIEELRALIAVLQKAARPGGIHPRDDIASQKARSTRVVAHTVFVLRASLDMVDRGPDKMHIVRALIESALHYLQP
jgi:hypothetical protein